MLENSKTLRKVFLDYQSKLEYARKVNFDDTIETINEIISIFETELIEV